MKTVIGDITVYYKVKKSPLSSARPLLLIHGNGGSHHSFDGVVGALARTHTCYCIDSRAQGRTTRGKALLTYPQLGQDLEGFIVALSLDKPDIIGYSDGGITALEVAAHSKNVGRIITLGANWDASGTTEAFLSYANGAVRVLDKFRIFPCARRRAELMRLMLESEHYDEWSALTRVTAPVLLMTGDADVIPYVHTEKMASLIQGSCIRIIKDCPHSIMHAKPHEFLALALDFLN